MNAESVSVRASGYVPAMNDAVVKAGTGRDWAEWFATLDEAGAGELDHRSTARLLASEYQVPSWWSQTLSVEYERARGRRVRHQSTRGFSVAVSKTVHAPLHKLYASAADAKRRRAWFPRGTFRASSKTKNKYLRGSWNETARLEIGFTAKGGHKSQIAVQVAKLAQASHVEAQRELWRAALEELQRILEK